MISVACLELGLELSAQRAIITVTVLIVIVIKVNVVPLDQKLQTQIPTGPR